MQDRIHIAEPSPPYCAACFQAKPQQRHVDFGAAYDGPTVPALENTIGVVGHTIDDLVICEDCLQLAAKLIGLEDSEALQKRIATRDDSIETLQERVEALERLNASLETTKKAREAIQSLSRRPRAKAAA